MAYASHHVEAKKRNDEPCVFMYAAERQQWCYMTGMKLSTEETPNP